ncbi:MAG: hypothetical protein HOP19_13360 [Acidobacteria bacterium]|nr:hypothetical protein [Acidobacteriota bacterium]
MTEHLSAQLILRYRTRALAPAELLALDRHLEGCERCRGTLRAWVDAPAPQDLHARVFAESAAEAAHVLPAQCRAYLNNRLDAVERELCESHWEDCATCETQFEALRTEVHQPLSGWRKLMRIEGLFATPLAGRNAETSEGLFAMPLVWRSAVAMAVLGLLTWGVTHWQRTRIVRDRLATSSPSVTPTDAAAEMVGATPAVLLALQDGGQPLMLDAQGKLRGAESLSDAEQTALKAALTTGTIETPRTLAGLQSKDTNLMNGSGNTEDAAKLWAARSRQTLSQPFGVIVAEARPTFRWKPLAGATHYTVIVSDPESNYREIAVSPKRTATSWMPPQALPRDRVLVWQVSAALPAGQEVTAPAPAAAEAKFRLLSQAQSDELKRGQQQYANRRLPLALLYARLGLIESAERELRALAKDNPQSPIVEKMLRDLRKK